MYDAIVIGAGHNGLIAACYLARAGVKTLVLERRDIVGGACVTEEIWPGYRVSTGAYLCSLLRPEIVRDLDLERHGFEAYRRDPAGFAAFPDGRCFFTHADAQAARLELQRFCSRTPADVDRYFQFEADVERAARVVDPFMLREPPNVSELRAAFSAAGAGALYGPFIEGSVRDLLDGRFEDEGLKAVLATDGLIGTYGGPSTPGTGYVLLHHYLGGTPGGRGTWGYVRGGMGSITAALAESLRAAGGEIRTCAPVGLLRTQSASAPGGRTAATGVALESGEEISASAVLSNADPYVTFVTLLAGAAACKSDAPWLALRSQGGASAKINLAVSELPRFTCLDAREGRPASGCPGPEHMGTVHLSPGLDYLDRAWHDAKRGYPSQEPMIEMYIQSASDSSIAPQGKHSLALFVQYFPYNLAAGLDLDTERDRFTERVIELVGRYAPNLPRSILHSQTLTPRELEARFGLTGGHIFHGDLLPPTLWDARPAPGFGGSRTPISGLYLCGSGAHPGGCVFGAPGFNAAQALLKDQRAAG